MNMIFKPLSLWRIFAIGGGIAFVLIGLSAGLFARFYELGSRSLAVDEYYFIRGVNFILEHGIPKIPSGGFYTRGLLAQYFTAASAMIFGKTGFAYRLPVVLFSLGSISLTYLYSRQFMGRILAGTVALALLVSSWHIEFARFARMYSAFQFFTLLFFISIHQAFFKGRWNLRYLPHVVLILTTLTHKLGILLSPFLFIPLIGIKISDRFPTKSHLYRFAILSVLTTYACFFYVRFPFRNYGVTNRLPEDYARDASWKLLRIPEFPFWSISDKDLVNLAFVLGIIFLTIIILSVYRRMGRNVKAADFVLAALIISVIFHQFYIALGCIALLLFRYQIHKTKLHPKRSYRLLFTALIIAIGWFGYAFISGNKGAIRVAFFGWPDFYHPLYVPWAKELPVLGLVAAGAVIYQFISKLRLSHLALLQNPAFIVAYIAVCFGLLHSTGTTTRYSFFIYPIMLITIVLSMKELSQKIITRLRKLNQIQAEVIISLVFLGTFALTRDFNPKHIAEIATDRVEFRMSEYQRFSGLAIPRPDFKSAAYFLNEHADDDEYTRIIIANRPHLSYYLKQNHAIYYHRRRRGRFKSISRARGTLELWSGNRLLSTEKELKEYTRGITTVWIARRKHRKRRRRHHFRAQEFLKDRLENTSRMFLSTDGRIEILLVKLKKDDFLPRS